MTDLPIHHFPGHNGATLAYRQLGQGRPLVLIHGYFSNATVNWIRYSHAARIAAGGRRVIMPDLRGHGDSAKPHEPAEYPPDVLADDGFALVRELGLVDYDLGGYSLGARTAMRMLVRGATPGSAIVAGMGLEGVVHGAERTAFFRRVLTNLGRFRQGSPEWRAEAFLKTTGGDPSALLRVLDTWLDTPREALTRIRTPTLVVLGAEDQDHGSGAELAALLPNGQHEEVPGNHMSAVTRPELGLAIAHFLAEQDQARDGSPGR